MQNALDELDLPYKLAVILADLEGFSYKEIAEILDLPLGTVMSRLYRGRKNLEEAMKNYRRDRYRKDGEPKRFRSRGLFEENGDDGDRDAASDQEYRSKASS